MRFRSKGRSTHFKVNIGNYAPIAHRLGISSIKWNWKTYRFSILSLTSLSKFLAWFQKRVKMWGRNNLKKGIHILHGEMEKIGVEAQIMGRPKHLYSIYSKMTKKGKGFSEIYDLIAVRIIVTTVRDCYSALGAVHSLWHPMPGRFKDYIAMPKFNMYRLTAAVVVLLAVT